MATLAIQRLYDIVTRSPEETIAFGRRLAETLRPPCLALLEGDLGSGKTTLAKGVASALAAAREEDVTSPSFTLVHEYGSPDAAPDARIYHVDLYRIEGPREIESLGLDEIISQGSTVLIEWGERLPQPPPGPLVRIRMDVCGENERHIVVEEETRDC